MKRNNSKDFICLRYDLLNSVIGVMSSDEVKCLMKVFLVLSDGVVDGVHCSLDYVDFNKICSEDVLTSTIDLCLELGFLRSKTKGLYTISPMYVMFDYR